MQEAPPNALDTENIVTDELKFPHLVGENDIHIIEALIHSLNGKGDLKILSTSGHTMIIQGNRFALNGLKKTLSGENIKLDPDRQKRVVRHLLNAALEKDEETPLANGDSYDSSSSGEVFGLTNEPSPKDREAKDFIRKVLKRSGI